MNTEALFLFLILLLGLVLCSFLGGNCGYEGFNTISEGYTSTTTGTTGTTGTTSTSGAATSAPIVGDNYNHVKGSMTSLQGGSTLYGPNGAQLVVVQNSDGTQSLDVTLPNGKKMTLDSKKQEKQDSFTKTSTTSVESYTNYYGANGTATTFYGPNGVTASVLKGENGQMAIYVETSNGDYTFTPNATYYNPETNSNSSAQYYGSTGYQVNTYQGAYGGEAAVATGPYGNTAYYAQGPYGNAVAGTTNGNPYYNGTNTNSYYGPYGGQVNTATGPYGNTAYYAEGPYGNAVAGTTNPYYGPHGGSAAAVTGPAGNTAYYAEGPNGNAVVGTKNNSEYYSSLPPGIPGSQIPHGQEDLYILKSQVVPPVCPVCPAVNNIAETIEKVKEAKCPPCPRPQRCAEPSFECKKVPNYNNIGNDQLPIPVLNDFSTFGM
jgi:hypothetical protein